MSKLSSFIYYLFNDTDHLMDSLVTNFLCWLPDEAYSRLRFRFAMGYWPDLKNPKTLNEKITWLKLYDRRPEYKKMVEKYDAKEYAAGIIGDQYIIPTIGLWNNPEDIDWGKLPGQFVLKTTHSGGNTGVIICKNKASFDKDDACRRLKESLKSDIYHNLREWVYKDIPRRIIAEQYIEDEEYKELRDYKFFCADGRVKALFVATERQKRAEPYFDFFDEQFNHLAVRQQHPNSPDTITKPIRFELMKSIASKLSQGLPFVRVDLYEANGKVYFGEMTFYHFAGIVSFDPESWDCEFGKWISLPVPMHNQ